MVAKLPPRNCGAYSWAPWSGTGCPAICLPPVPRSNVWLASSTAFTPARSLNRSSTTSVPSSTKLTAPTWIPTNGRPSITYGSLAARRASRAPVTTSPCNSKYRTSAPAPRGYIADDTLGDARDVAGRSVKGPVGFAVVGAGLVGPRHAEFATKAEGARLAVVCDLRED